MFKASSCAAARGWQGYSKCSCTLIASLTFSVILFSGDPRSLLAGDPSRDGHVESKREQPPAAVVAEAERLGLAGSTIEKRGDRWVACVGSGQSAACIVVTPRSQELAARSMAHSTTPAAARPSPPEAGAARLLTGLTDQDVLQVNQYGMALQTASVAGGQSPHWSLRGLGRIESQSGTKAFRLFDHVEARVSVVGRPDAVLDTLPQFRREGPALVRTKDYRLVQQYVDAHPEEPFVVLVTVPAHCEPCRQMDRMISQTLGEQGLETQRSISGQPHSVGAKTFVLEYFSFADAEREVLGSGAIFPTTLVYGAGTQPRRSISRFIGSGPGPSLELLSRSLRDKMQRGTPHTVTRGSLGRDLFLSLLRSKS